MTDRAPETEGCLTDASVEWIDDITNKVRDARTGVTTLHRASVAEAVEAFAHIARAGQPVSAADVERALLWSTPQSSPTVPGMRR